MAMTVINTLEELGQYIDVGEDLIVRFFLGFGMVLGRGIFVGICWGCGG
jgi:hypothetical protein